MAAWQNDVALTAGLPPPGRRASPAWRTVLGLAAVLLHQRRMAVEGALPRRGCRYYLFYRGRSPPGGIARRYCGRTLLERRTRSNSRLVGRGTVAFIQRLINRLTLCGFLCFRRRFVPTGALAARFGPSAGA